jgi:3'-phosphoadenosine 5'-phosphosulfate sulfotransferase (PAPS reductase)/FAD synthetase
MLGPKVNEKEPLKSCKDQFKNKNTFLADSIRWFVFVADIVDVFKYSLGKVSEVTLQMS